MDILDLVALMKKYATENPEILEFEENKNAFTLNAKGNNVVKDFYFQIIDNYEGQKKGELKCSFKDIFFSNEGNFSIDNIQINIDKWFKSIKKSVDLYSSLQQGKNLRGDSIKFFTTSFTTTPATPISFAFLNNLIIKDFFCIQEKIELDSLENKKEIYFLGENGDGKTLILQAILIAFKWHFIEHESMAEFTGKVSDLVKSAGVNLEITATDSSNIYSYKSEEISIIRIENRLNKIKYLKNIFAYGVNRRYNPKSENKEQYGFMTLFDDSQYLRSPIEWLKKIKLDETEESYQGIKLTNSVEILEHLLADNVKIKINGSKVKFIERGSEVDFNELSEGYKSVMTWVADLVSRLAENQPDVKPIQIEEKTSFPYQGIVLVDEISLHLHPKWEYDLVRKLRGWFPNIQFIMTTHSPVTVLGASEEAIFYRVYKENGITHVSEPYSSESIKNLMANGVLTSPLFDLDSAAMRVAEDENKDTSEDFTYTLIHKQIAEQVKKLKSEGKVYISQEMLNQMVAKAIEKHKKAS